MNEKKIAYQSTFAGLPSLKVVLGDVPHPDGESRRPFHPFPFVAEKPDGEVRTTVKKLIGYMKDSK
jgi:hypothetical protein